MTKVSHPSAPKLGRTHRTHEERSAETKERLIEAAISCLHKYGYGATTTSLVAQEAGFSRGAMLHHFGAKVDLMLAVAEAVLERHNAFYAEGIKRFALGRERFVGLTDLTWEIVSKPPATALLEIMIASRSDVELGERFSVIAEKYLRMQNAGTWIAAKQAGITDRVTINALSQLYRSAMQGLSIVMMFSPERDSIQRSFYLLKWFKEIITEELIATAGSEASVPPASGKPTRPPKYNPI